MLGYKLSESVNLFDEDFVERGAELRQFLELLEKVS
jgi:hypothetical protein